MKKVIVIGCCGSGKSTFARQLHAHSGIPLFHLDMLNWRADKTTVSEAVFLERLQTVLQGESWIVDGNYGTTMDMRMQACDTIFFLDYPADVCINGIIERVGKYRGDMPWIEETVDTELMEFVKSYSVNERPHVLALLEKYHDKEIYIFQSRSEAEKYLQTQ